MKTQNHLYEHIILFRPTAPIEFYLLFLFVPRTQEWKLTCPLGIAVQQPSPKRFSRLPFFRL